MAEILVKAIDASHPTKDYACYKAGDPIVIMPDGWTWGKEEKPPVFYIIKVIGKDPKDLKNYTDIQWSKILTQDGDKNFMIRRRRYKIDITNLSAQEQSDISTKGSVEITDLKLISAIVDKAA